MNKGGFSWKRLAGVTRVKSNISRSIGIPLTRTGRQRKLGGATGCCSFYLVIFVIIIIVTIFLVLALLSCL